jgi:hypothetical protein
MVAAVRRKVMKMTRHISLERSLLFYGQRHKRKEHLDDEGVEPFSLLGW